MNSSINVVKILALLLLFNPNFCWAASGGRMGGNLISSSDSSSEKSSSNYYQSSSSYNSHINTNPNLSSTPTSESSYSSFGFIAIPIVGFVLFVLFSENRKGNICLIKLQVGLLGTARSVLSDLNQTAETADTSTRKGLSYMLTETTLALLHHSDYCISACSSLDILKGSEECDKRFKELSTEERMKLDGETLVNVDSIKKRQSLKGVTTPGLGSEFIVVTILLAANNVDELPSINCRIDLKEALEKLGSIASQQIMAVEVIWTPQNENDSFSEEKLHHDYPLLQNLKDHDIQIDCSQWSKMDDKKCE